MVTVFLIFIKFIRAKIHNCTAHQCLPLSRKFMICSIIQLARSILMKRLVIGQRQKASNFSAFHWNGFHWSAFRNYEGSTFTEKGRNKLNYRIGSLRSDSVIKLVSNLITESDQAVRAVHSCNSWSFFKLKKNLTRR